MEILLQKNDETAKVNARNIIANFEKGPVSEAAEETEEKEVEKVVSKPGGAKKLMKQFEERIKPEPVPEITRLGKRPTFGSTVAENGVLETMEKEKRKVLIIFGHMERKSFNGNLFNETVNFLKGQGHQVTITDLYEMAWKSPSCDDAGESVKVFETSFYEDAMLHALKNGNLAPEIVEEQRKVAEADLIILQFPIHNSSFPAIVKSWIERVMIQGFAFDPSIGEIFEEGKMKGKKILLSFTTASPEPAYSKAGLMGDMNVPLWVMEYGAFRFFGFDILPAAVYHNINMSLPEEPRQKYTSEWLSRLENVFSENPKNFVDMNRFDIMGTWTIKPDDPFSKAHISPNVAQTF